MTITVTQEDIDKGVRRGCCDCPIALAIIRTYQSFYFVHVDSDVACINGNDWDLPDNAQDFIDKFDCGYPVQPFTFELA